MNCCWIHRAAGAAAITAAAAMAVASPAMADYRSDVGYTQLQGDLGLRLPDGAGVAVTQVEGAQQVDGQQAWLPDGNDPEFAGKTIANSSNAPAGLSSGHATGVAAAFYGLTRSIAPGITSISAYSATDWPGARFLHTTPDPTTGWTPQVSTSRIGNHSWVGSALPFNTYALRRMDWVIATDEFMQFVGLNNGDGISASTTPLFSSSYNAIAVGRSDGLHTPGTVAIDAEYRAGRAKPDIVDPAGTTSSATPHVAAAAALLVQTGHGKPALSVDPVAVSTTNRAGAVIRNAERSEVIKAALLAGADRVTHNSSAPDLDGYRGSLAHKAGNGLDVRYGAGQLNVRNSYWIIAGGEQGSREDGNQAASVGSRGFDYDSAFGGSDASNIAATYPLAVRNKPRLLTAALVWNMDITGPSGTGFNTTATLRNLDLAVVDTAAADRVVAISQSLVDNTENIWFVVPANARYALRVTRSGTFRWDYGLAWQLLADRDGDGVPDALDNCILQANGPMAPDAGDRIQLDADGDGYGNRCDADLDNNGVMNAGDATLFRGALGTPDAKADLDGNGKVDARDQGLFKALLGGAPGPSGLHP